jgi:hypothetical protein
MALTWNWNSKIGTVRRPNIKGEYFYTSLYRGNAFLIEIYEDEQGETYSLQSFLVDKRHAKNMVDDECRTYENLYDGTPTRVILIKDAIDKKELKDYLYYITMLGGSVELV